MGKILILTGNKEKKDAIGALCQSLRIELMDISGRDIDTPFNLILGLGQLPQEILSSKKNTPNKKAPALYNPKELLIFYGLTDKELEAFLEKYKTLGLSPILNKGIITPYNISWTPYELIVEYEKEREGGI